LLAPVAAATEVVVYHGVEAFLVHLLSGALLMEKPLSDRGPFDALVGHFNKVETFADIKYGRWLLFEFGDRAQGDNLLEALKARGCDLFGVNAFTSAEGSQKHTALCSRTQMRKKFLPLAEFNITNIYVLDLKGRADDTAGFVVRVCAAWIGLGFSTKANFAIRGREELTWRDLEKRWHPMTAEACEAELLDSEERVKLKRGATASDKVIVAMGAKVLKRKRDALVNHPSFVLFADDTRIIDLAEFQFLDRVIVLDWCVEDGSLYSYPLMDWIDNEHYRTRTLIVTGDSDKGKTQVAKSMLARLAEERQTGRVPRPYIITSQTVEGLMTAASGGWCQEWVGLLLDELRPGQPRGTRPPMTMDEIKKLCSIDIAATIDARHHDIMLSVDQPRIVTANAMDPSQWHSDLPYNLYSMDVAGRLRLSPDVKAVGKRISWALVEDSLISQSMRDAYTKRRG
jgi:hypothetical protein